MRAYWLSPGTAVARMVSGPSVVSVPLSSSVPAAAVTGIGSPRQPRVVDVPPPLDAARVAGDHLSRPHEEAVADDDLVDDDVVERASSLAHAVGDAGRILLQRPHGRRRPSLGVALERLAAGLHEDDDEAGDRLVEQHGADDGERGDDVRRELPAEDAAQRAPDERRAGDDEPGEPDGVAGARVAGEAHGEAGADQHDREDGDQGHLETVRPDVPRRRHWWYPRW